MSRPIAKILGVFAGVIAILLLAAILMALRTPVPAAAPLPVPNAYDEFLRAAILVADETPDFPGLSQEKLRETVAKNKEALELVRAGLSHESRVPLNSVTNAAHLADMANLKRLAQAFAAEAKLAELENRPADAAKSCMDTIRLGHECSRGGVIIDCLVGMAVEAIGITPLEKLAANLDAKQCRDIAAALEATESKREPATVILQQEKAWARRTFGWKGQIIRLMSFRQYQAGQNRFLAKLTTVETRTHRLMIDVASRAYELDHGARPKTPADLVPQYLKTVPTTPVTNQAMTSSP